MLPSDLQCDSDRLESYLQGNACESEMRAIELHLDGCQRCRKEMQLLAADKDFWIAATSSLETLAESRDDAPPLTVENCLSVVERGLLESSVKNDVDGGTQSYLELWLGPARTDDSLGSLNEYDILSIIGSGGMGLVLKGRDRSLGRTVAIKTLRQHLTADLAARRRFAREAQIAASLRHHHIIDIYTVEVWRDVPYFVMPFMPQGTLRDFRNARGARRFELDEILSVVRQLASGLAEAHRRGMMHRDIKPSNVLIERELERVLIADFGLARSIDDEGLTCSSWVAGTPQFMSPEQASGKPIDHRSDLFSLGSLMYWMAAGEPPFTAETNYGVISKIVNETPSELSHYRTDLPSWFIHLLFSLLSKDPSQRRYTAHDIATILDQFQRDGVPPMIAFTSKLAEQPAWKGKQWLRRSLVVSLSIVVVSFISIAINKWYEPSNNDSALVQTPSSQQKATDSQSTIAPETITKVQSQRDSTPESSSVSELQREFRSTTDEVASFESTRMGPLDSLDEVNLLAELPKDVNTRYWLERLSKLSASEIPVTLLPIIERLANTHANSNIQQLAVEITNKSPFEEMEREQRSTISSDTE